jgi:hypothetical protein
LGKNVKLKELAQVEMKAMLQQAGLEHFAELPQLWPPSLAVGLSGCPLCVKERAVVRFLVQVREFATRVQTLKKAG